ncbi:MAG: UvrD-helicase domain-containing protein [Bacilli bacterium]
MPKWTDEQLTAINKEGQNIIVSAGAGSGKTAVLSSRVIRKLIDGSNIDELLILTFTNAAANEMKERIRQKIKEIPSLKDQLIKIDSAYITTFDAYALSIVKKYHTLINISEEPIIGQASIVNLEKERILDELFEELYKEANPNFLNFIADFCLKDDIEIKQALKKMNDNLDLLYDKDAYLDTYINTYYNNSYLDNIISKYINNLIIKIKEIEDLLPTLNSLCENTYYNSFKAVLEPLLNSNTYDSIKLNSLLKLPNAPRGSSLEFKKSKDQISTNLKLINKCCKYNKIDDIKEALLKTKRYVVEIIEIIKKYTQRIDTYKKEKDVYDFIDIAKMAIQILEKNPLICKDIKDNFKEILIDEYQDTSDLQELFISLIANNNVYMVGDIKQSIYRFRNANPNLFKQKYEAYSLNQDGYRIDLNKNFRSRKEVLDNINLLFGLVMDSELGGCDYNLNQKMLFGNMSYNEEGKTNQDNNFEILNYDKETSFSNTEVEIFTIASDILDKVNNHYQVFDKDKSIKRDVCFNDFAILMDRGNDFNLYKKIFEYLNIPLTIYKDESISNSVDIDIIKNIYQFILKIKKQTFDKIFEYCYLSIARSYLFNLDDNEIFNTIKNKTINKTDIYKIASAIAIDEITNSQLLEKIIYDFKFYTKIMTIGDIDKHLVTLEYLLQLANDSQKIGYTCEEFSNYLITISAKDIDVKCSLNKDNSNSCKIMTIHASKGLEYYICYYSGLDKKFNIKELNDKFLFDKEYGFITPYLDKGMKSTITKELLKNRYLKEEISEKIRLFYVALTRAKEKMILITSIIEEDNDIKEIVPINERLKYMSFKDILASTYKYIKNYIKLSDSSKIGLTKDYNKLKKNNYKNNIILTNETLKVVEYQNKAKLVDNNHYSKISHELYNDETLENINLGINIHKIFYNTDFNNHHLNNSYEENKVLKFINSGLLKDTINIYKEYEFMYEKNGLSYHGIIDLLLEYENCFKIIDYKLKKIYDEAYIKQLKGYKEYIETLSSKKVDIYLYSIIDEQLIKL